MPTATAKSTRLIESKIFNPTGFGSISFLLLDDIIKSHKSCSDENYIVATISLVLFAVAVGMVFFFHVATAWVGMLGFMAAGVAGMAYLKTTNRKWDIASMAAVEISLVFF